MKSVVADYQTRIFAVRIAAVDGINVARFVSYPHDLEVGSVTYHSTSGYEFTGLSSTNNMAPSVVDLRGIVSDAVGHLEREDVAARVWDNAKAYLFATSWTSPTEDEEPLGKFLLGKCKFEDDRYIFEMMSLIDALNQSTGLTVGPLCPWTLFDETLDGDVIPWHRSRCTGPRGSLADGPNIDDYRVTGTITGVTSRTVFRDSSRAESDDYFGVGSVRFTTGNNAGLRSEEVKSYDGTTLPGTITTFQPFPYSIQVGDQYEMIPGCRKRLSQDCVTKFSNGINHGGFTRVPTPSQYTDVGVE